MKTIYLECKKLYIHFDKILFLFAFAFAVVEFVWVPVNSWLSELLLSWTGHAYLSPANVWAVLAEKWWVTVGFILLVLLNLIIAYLEVGLIVVGIIRLLGQEESLSSYLRHVWQEIKRVASQMNVSKVLFTLTYSVVFFPFLKRILRIYYLDKIVIPQFILEYISNNVFFGGLLTVCLLVFFWLATRLMYTLPLIYQDGKNVTEAIRLSLERTKSIGQWKVYVRLLWLVLQPLLGFALIAALLYGLQIFADTLPEAITLVCAVVHYIVLQLAYYGVITLFLLKFISLTTQEEWRLPTRKNAITVCVLPSCF